MTSSPTRPAPTTAPARGRARRVPSWAVLAIAALAQFMVVLDVSIVNVALPSMRADLGMSAAGLAWVVNAYALTFAGLLLLGGRAADLFGRKRVFLLGVVLFSLASLVGGFAPSEGWLVAARALQGVGGAVLAPATLTLLTTTYTDPGERARALGVWGAVAGAGGAMGGLVGGVLTELLGWRWVLFVNVPIGAVLLAGAAWALTEAAGRPRSAGLRGLDVPGAAAVTVGLSAVVYAVLGTESNRWGSAATLVPLLGGLVLLALFLVVESRSRQPLVPLGIFRRRALSVANAVALLIGMGMFSFWFFVSLQLQRVQGFDPLEAGLAFLPASAALIAASAVATRLVRRVGAKPLLVAGPLTTAVGMAWLSGLTPDGTYAGQLLAQTVVVATGMGLTMVPLTVAATAGVPLSQAGLASGLINTSRQMGGALGLAVLSTVAAHRTAGLLGSASADAAGAAGTAALVSGYGRALLVGAVLVAAGALVALLLPAREAPADDAERSAEAGAAAPAPAG